MASIIVSWICIICCIPEQGFCHKEQQSFKSDSLAKKFLNEIYRGDFLENFDAFDKSQDLLEDGKKFLAAFLKEIQFHYGLNLTIKDACQLIGKNIHFLAIPIEIQNVILEIVDLFESNNPPHLQHQQLECSAMIASGIYWPWEYVHLIKKQLTCSLKKTRSNFISFFQPIACETKEIELPSDIYIGGAELLAGALCMIVGTVIPPFYAAGTVLLGDGANRVYNGISQLGEERRNHSNNVPVEAAKESREDFGKCVSSYYLQVLGKNS